MLVQTSTEVTVRNEQLHQQIPRNELASFRPADQRPPQQIPRSIVPLRSTDLRVIQLEELGPLRVLNSGNFGVR